MFSPKGLPQPLEIRGRGGLLVQFVVRLRTLFVPASFVLLAGCAGGSGTPVGPSETGALSSGAMVRAALRPARAAGGIQDLYQFAGGSSDGGYPYGSVIVGRGGALYGATNGGGPADAGTVFALTRSGSGYAETVVHAFGASGDGALPYGTLLPTKSGTIYGTAYSGGTGAGCVFALTPVAGKYSETVVYDFAGSPLDGAGPYAGLSEDASGNLYGTTLYGGQYGAGTVFALRPNGSGGFVESVVYSFGGGADGGTPYGGVIAGSGGTLYGTTTFGGSGNGVVYALTPGSGGYSENVLHTFAGGAADGANPRGALLESGGALYGTTLAGGSAGLGTAFKIANANNAYAESVIHDFAGGNDGASPYAGLTEGKAGAMYGTTFAGGANGAGTIFALKRTGKTYAESVVAPFPGYPNPANPYGGIAKSSAGELFGATFGGGTNGFGTVYSIRP
jgi:uncharacterized repeat protein (TIGR03803 family)